MSELELQRWFDDVAVPEGTVDMLASVARDAVRPYARARRRRRAVVVAVAAALAAATAAVAYELLDDDGLSVPAGPPPARVARLESPLLSRLPWLFQPSGAPRIDEVPEQPSLIFPEGTSYGRGVTRLFEAVSAEGALPEEARLDRPLPAGVVAELGGAGRGVRIDLRAPYGYDLPSGRISAPGFVVDPAVPAETIRAVLSGLQTGRLPIGRLPAGIRVEVPRLAACQVLRPGVARTPCRLTGGAPGGP
jgi:hypothetical protein